MPHEEKEKQEKAKQVGFREYPPTTENVATSGLLLTGINAGSFCIVGYLPARL
mgnify:CR=1 FL=1